MTLAWRRWELGALCGLIAVGAWLRLPHMNRGITGDEVGLLQFRGWDWLLRDSLNVLHPPLFRMSFRAFLEPTAAVEAGRLVSLCCGLAAIVVVAILARRVSGNRWAGLLAGGLFAGLPCAIIWSAVFRPYAMLTLLMAVHLWALCCWVEAGPGLKLRHAAVVAGTALVMPQVHYLAVPWLVLTGVGVVIFMRLRWWKLWVYLPAMLAFLPLVPLLLDPPSRGPKRRSGDLQGAMEWLLEMGVNAGEVFPGSTLPFTVLAVVLTGCLWRRAGPSVRVVLLGAVGLIITVGVSASQHAMTSSTTLLGAPVLIPLVVGLPFLVVERFPRTRLVGGIIAAWALIAMVRMGVVRHVDELLVVKPRDRHAMLLDRWQEWVPDGHDVAYAFPTDVSVARLVFTDGLMSNKVAPECGKERRCFVHEGRRWTVANLDNLPPGNWVVVWTRTPPRAELPDRCTIIDTGPDEPWIAQCAQGAG